VLEHGDVTDVRRLRRMHERHATSFRPSRRIVDCGCGGRRAKLPRMSPQKLRLLDGPSTMNSGSSAGLSTLSIHCEVWAYVQCHRLTVIFKDYLDRQHTLFVDLNNNGAAG
jgi:hypothetical protein